MPKISIITPCYNAAPYLRQMIESVRAQSLPDFEHVIVDDGSVDASAAIVEELARSDPRLRLVRQSNAGVARARNAGFRAASADSGYLLFLDADDCIAPTMLQVLTGYLDAHPHVGLAYCDFECIDEAGNPAPKPPTRRVVPARFGVRVLRPQEPLTPLESIVCWAPVMESLSVLRRSIFQTTPGWNESLGQIGEGVELFSRFALRSEVHFVPQVLYQYRQHARQSTATPGQIQSQQERINALLPQMSGLSAEELGRIRSACRFRDYRFAATVGLGAANSHLRQHQWTQAARCFLGAMRRLAVDFVSRRRPGPGRQATPPGIHA